MNKTAEISIVKTLFLVAWSDGQLHPKETILIENIIKQISDLSPYEYIQLSLYREYPTTPQEKEIILRDFVEKVESKELRKLALNRIKALIQIDGVVSRAEEKILNEIEKNIQFRETFRKRFLKLINRHQPIEGKAEREEEFEKLISNPALKQYLDQEIASNLYHLNLDHMRKAYFAGSVLSHLIAQDSTLDQEKTQNILKIHSTFRGNQITLIHQLISQPNTDLPGLHEAALQLASTTRPSEREQLFAGLCKIATQEKDPERSAKILREIIPFLLIEESKAEEYVQSMFRKASNTTRQ